MFRSGAFLVHSLIERVQSRRFRRWFEFRQAVKYYHLALDQNKELCQAGNSVLTRPGGALMGLGGEGLT